MKTKRPVPGPFAANLRTLLEARNLTYDQVNAKTGIHPRRVQRLALGGVQARLDEVPVLARLLGVTPTDLAWTDTEIVLATARKAEA